MPFPIDWPMNIKDFLCNSYGEPIAIDRLNGLLPERGSFRLRFAKESVIVKRSQHPREWRFYQQGAPVLRQYDVEIPNLHMVFQAEGMYWLVMEAIPHAFPQSRWRGDSEQIAMLVRLHARTWGKGVLIEEPFVPAWNEELLDKAMTLFEHAKAAEIKQWLGGIWEFTERLLEARCTLSGDPNPTNWGLRSDGTLVLFDWERVGLGSPAVDLAITMPGFGTPDDSLEKLVATKYLECWDGLIGEVPMSVKELIQQIKLAKVWTALEFLADHTHLLTTHTVQTLVEGLSEKIAGLCKSCTH